MFEISTNADDVARELEEMARQIQPAQERGLDAGAQILKGAKQVEKAKTYVRPTKGKKKRSGDFKRGDVIESEPGERRIVMTGPAADYEEKLANLPKSRDGVDRSNPAADNAFKSAANDAADAVEDEIESVFR